MIFRSALQNYHATNRLCSKETRTTSTYLRKTCINGLGEKILTDCILRYKNRSLSYSKCRSFYKIENAEIAYTYLAYLIINNHPYLYTLIFSSKCYINYYLKKENKTNIMDLSLSSSVRIVLVLFISLGCLPSTVNGIIFAIIYLHIIVLCSSGKFFFL